MTPTVDLKGARVYIAGKMRGLPEFNFPAFHTAHRVIRDLGAAYIFNPAERDECDGFNPAGKTGHEDLAELGFDLTAARRRDLTFIVSRATHIWMLDGWRASQGATFERAVALECGVIVIEAPL